MGAVYILIAECLIYAMVVGGLAKISFNGTQSSSAAVRSLSWPLWVLFTSALIGPFALLVFGGPVVAMGWPDREFLSQWWPWVASMFVAIPFVARRRANSGSPARQRRDLGDERASGAHKKEDVEGWRDPFNPDT